MADFAFGTYRISDGNEAHIDALVTALTSGITLIDTSTNYYNGGAERAIAKALKRVDPSLAASVKIVSKFGYIQGSLLEEYHDTNSKLSQIACDVVEYSKECFHSIAPEFVHDQLTCSLSRLEQESIDCYLVHNPEYFIYDAIKKGVPKDEYLDAMQQRLFDAFVALEEEVQAGRITSYGVSSNSFAKPKDAPDFLPYEDLTTLAQKAAQKIGATKHSFSTIELPINILEKEGLHATFWAKEEGVRVLSNRPLNAFYNGEMLRLAEYDESSEYYMVLNELLEYCDNELLRPIYNLVNELDAMKHRFGFVGNWDAFVHTQVLPHLKRSLEGIKGEVQERILNYLEIFLVEYKEMVAYESGKKTKELLQKRLNCHERLQDCALKYLLEQESIDYVIIGARRVKYVYEILALKESFV